MGSYGIGVTRVMAIIAERHHDDKGLIWPEAVAPYDVHVIAASKDDQVTQVASELAESLHHAGRDVLFDDRPKVSPGVKFADAEVIGVPHIVIAGARCGKRRGRIMGRAPPTNGARCRFLKRCRR